MKLLHLLNLVICYLLIAKSFAQFRVAPSHQNLPAFFTENKGHITDQHGNPREDIKFLYNDNGLKIHLKNNSFSYEQYIIKPLGKVSEATGLREQIKEYEYLSHRIDIQLVGANPKPTIVGLEKSTDYQNFYLPHTPDGVLKVYDYQKVIYQNIYPYIDLIFSISEDENKESFAKYEFVVKPKGNPADIRLAYQGAEKLFLSANNLQIKTAYGVIQEDAPISFTKQNIIKSRYILKDNVLSFQIDKYNPKDTLIIDPRIRNFGTYIGSTETGGNTTEIEGFDSDASNTFFYVAGNTTGTASMATSGTFQTVQAGNGDAFVWKMSHATGQRIWGTHIGGANTENIFDLACNKESSPKIAIAGLTRSTNFPANTFQTTYGGGGEDGFLAVFNDDGTRSWSAYYGASSEETLYGVAYDNNHDLVFIGRSGTSNQAALVTAGTYQPTLSGVGNTDAIVGKFNPSGTRVWATFYGGTQGESGISIAADNNNDIIIAGRTNTPTTTNIASSGAHQTTRAGGNDLFVAKLNSAGTTRAWGTYYGGTDEEGSNEFNYGVTVRTNKTNGDIYVAATTKSVTNIASAGAHQTTYAGTASPYTGFGDGFLVKFNTNGVRQWATYYGGNNAELLDGLSVASNGDVLISGMTISSAGIATTDAFRRNLADSTLAMTTRQDGFFALFDSNGNRKYATYYGGKGFDQFRTAHLADDGTIYVAGNTFSSDCNQIATTDGFINSSTSFSKGFLVKFSPTGTRLSIACLQANLCAGTTIKVPIFPEGTFGVGNQFIVELSDASGSFSSPTNIGTVTATTADSVTITIPTTTPAGFQYLMRVRSTNPAIVSTDNGAYISISTPLFGFNNITPSVSTVCAEATLSVSYFTSCALIVGSSVIAELSDASGSFASPTQIGTLTVNSLNAFGGSFMVTIPAVSSGTGYRIRIRATNPAVISTPFTTVYTINTPTKPNLGADRTVCSSALLDAGAGYSSYLWNTGATTQTITASSSGDYIVRVTQSGCTARDTVRVTIEKPQWEWAVRGGGNATSDGEGGRALVGDALGNAYTAGAVRAPVSGAVAFQSVSGGNTTIPTLYGGRDIYITKYNQNGEVVWAQAAGGSADDLAGGLTLSADNKLYLVGFVGNGTVTFGSTHLGGSTISQTAIGNNAFIAVYDTSGKILHARILTGGTSSANRVGFDRDGNYYVVGSFNGTTDFGNGKTLTVSSSTIFIAKYNNNNQCVWAVPLNGTGLQVNRVGVDALGNSYLRGWYQGDSLVAKNIGGVELPVTQRNNTLTHFAAKHDSSGTLQWVIRVIDGAPAGTETNEGGIITDTLGNTYFSGQFSGTGVISPTEALTSAGGQDIFLMKIRPDGTREWVRSVGSTGNDISYDIATDQYGDIYMTGRFQNSIQLGTSTLTSNPGASDIFVAKFDGAGNVQWAQQSKSTGNPTPRPFSIATAPNISGQTQVYVTGDFRSNTYRYELKDCNTTTLISSGLEDIFLAKLGQPFNQIIVNNVSPTVFCTGSTVTVNFKAKGDYFTGNRFIVQMSDSTGGFTNPTNIGSIISKDTTGTVPIILTMPPLPNGGGSGHRVRVIATDRPTIGTSSSVNLVVLNAFAGKDTTLCGTNAMTLQASADKGVGTWSVISGTATFSDVNNPNAQVTNLAEGINRLAWTKTQAGCTNVADTVQITVTNLVKPTAKQMDNWTFGANAAVSFASGTIQNKPSIAGTTTSNPGLHSTISDSLGNFLFSFDGQTVRDTIGVFTNGSGFNSDLKATLIVPAPANKNAYWLFYNRNISGLQRAFVDLPTRSITLKDNRVTPLGVEVTQHLAGVGDGAGAIWVVVRRASSQVFTAYKVQGTGATLTSVNSTIGLTTPSGSSGVLRFSPDGTRAAMTVQTTTNSWVELYNFNPATGQFSNLVTLESPTNTNSFLGVEFSPDATKLYVTTGGNQDVFQYDLANGNTKTLLNNKAVAMANSLHLRNMLLANDGKIYVAYGKGIGTFTNSLAVIESPNSAGLSANYRDTAFNLGTPSNGDLVQFVSNYYKPVYVPFGFTYRDTCLGQATQFEAIGTNLKSVRWDFGITSATNDTSRLLKPTFTYPTAGTYTLTLTADLGCSEFTQTRSLTINTIPTVNLGADRDSCAIPIVLDAGNQPSPYSILWNTGATTRHDTVTSVGKYWVKVSNGACVASDTVNINFSGVYNSYHDRNWLFGDGCWAEFNTTRTFQNVTAFSGIRTNGGHGKIPSTFSMPDGRLKVWTDAESIGGFNSSTQTSTQFITGLASNMGASLVMPLSDTNNYIIFYTADNGLKSRNVNATTGTVNFEVNRTSGKNITKHLAGVYDGTNHFWIVTHQASSNNFIALKYDKAGTFISTVETSIGKVLSNREGVVKFSKNGQKIAFTGLSSSGAFVQWFDFNLNTGVLSNPQGFDFPTGSAYGVEFSPDGTKLYVSAFGATAAEIHQFDLSDGNKRTVIGQSTSFLSLQSAPDGKIYVAHEGFAFDTLGIIYNPNGKGLSARFQDNQVLASGGVSSGQLPQFIANYGSNQIGLSLLPNPACDGQVIQLVGFTNKANNTKYDWNFGDGNTDFTGKSTVSRLYNTTITSTADTFIVHLTMTTACNTDTTLIDTLRIFPAPVFDIPDTTNCSVSNMTLTIPLSGLTYAWYNANTGALLGTNQTLNVTTGGRYVASARNAGGCTWYDTINVGLPAAGIGNPNLNITGNCSGTPIGFKAINPTGFTFTSWKFEFSSAAGDTLRTTSDSTTKTYSTSGTYNIKLTGFNGCVERSFSTTLIVNESYTPTLTILTSRDTACVGSSVTLRADTSTNTSFTYQWFVDGTLQSGQTSSQITRNNLLITDTLFRVVATPQKVCSTVPQFDVSRLIKILPSATMSFSSQLTATPNFVCEDDTVTLNFKPQNYIIEPLKVEWFKRGILRATTFVNGGSGEQFTFKDTIKDNAGFQVRITSSYQCMTSDTLRSSEVFVQVQKKVTPSVFGVSREYQCAGGETKFTFSVNHRGANPTFYLYRISAPAKLIAKVVNPSENSIIVKSDSIPTGGTFRIAMKVAETCVTNDSVVSGANTISSFTPSVTPTLNLIPSEDTICQGSSVTLFVRDTLTSTWHTYRWFKGGTLLTGENKNTLSLNNIGLSDSVFAVEITPAVVCKTVNTLSDTVRILVKPTEGTATVQLTASSPVCVGDTVKVEATTNLVGSVRLNIFKNGVLWRSAMSNNITASDTLLGNATFLATAKSLTKQCLVTGDSLTSTVRNVAIINRVTPSVSLNPNDSVVCASGNAIFSPSNLTNSGGNPQFKWYINGVAQSGFSSSSTFTILQAQIGSLLKEGDKLHVVMKTSETCVIVDTAVSNSLTIDTVSQIIPLLTIQSNKNTVCEGDSIRFRIVSQSGQGVAPSYQWLSNNADITGANDTAYTAKFSANTYQVAVRMTSSAGCIAVGNNPVISNPITVTFQPNQTTTIAIEDITNPAPPYICPKIQLDFRAKPQNAGTNPSYIWRLNQNPTATNATEFSHNNWKGIDTVRLIVYPDFTCKVADSVIAMRIISISPNPLELGNNQTVCTGTEVTLKPTNNFAGKNPTYQWNNGQTTPEIKVSSAGTYSLTTTFPGGCQYKDTITVTYLPKPVVSLGNDTSYCKVVPSRTLDAGSGTNYRYKWSTGDTTQKITVNSAGIYSVRVNINGNTDCEGMDTIRLLRNDGPKLTPIFDFTICEDDMERQEVSAGTADSYLWQPSGETTPTIFIDKIGTYSVTLTDKQGCSNTDTFTVSRLCKPTVIVPQAFTPNADGKNDYFQVYARNISSFELSIYNRWGELVYYSTDENEKWWGKHREIEVPSGMYVYRLEYKGTEHNSSKEVKLGEIQLVR